MGQTGPVATRLRPARDDDAPAVAEVWWAGWREAHLGQVPDELVDLRGGVELGLVADQVVDPAAAGERVDDVRPEVEVGVDLERVVGQPEPAGQDRLAGAVVSREDPADTAACRVVVVGLERQGALAGVHRAGEELQLCHGS